MMPSDELVALAGPEASVTQRRGMSHLGAFKCHDCSKNILHKEILLIPGVLNSLHICENKRAFNTWSTVKISNSGDAKWSLTINACFTRKKQEPQHRPILAPGLGHKAKFIASPSSSSPGP